MRRGAVPRAAARAAGARARLQLLGLLDDRLPPRHRPARAISNCSSGRDALTSYRFGSGTAEHLFCARCGVKSFYQPRSHPEAWSVNAHCLDEPVALAIEPFDGRDWEAARAALD